MDETLSSKCVLSSDIKAMFISGFSIDGDAQGLFDMGARAFLQKPFNFADFSRTVEKVLNEDKTGEARSS